MFTYHGFEVALFVAGKRDSDSMKETIIKIIISDQKNKISIINNARNTIINNHLIPYQIEQFKLLYKESSDNYCINE